jgi:hypothetical protein
MPAYIFAVLHVEELEENLRRRKDIVDEVLRSNLKQLVDM